jgi:hypothetical protein
LDNWAGRLQYERFDNSPLPISQFLVLVFSRQPSNAASPKIDLAVKRSPNAVFYGTTQSTCSSAALGGAHGIEYWYVLGKSIAFNGRATSELKIAFGGGAEAQRPVSVGAFESRWFDQKCPNDAMDDL